MLAPRVTVEPQALVIGDIIAVSAMVYGHVQGNVFADHLTLDGASSIEGEIHYAELALKEGAYFGGKSRRDNAPRRFAARFSVYDHSEAM